MTIILFKIIGILTIISCLVFYGKTLYLVEKESQSTDNVHIPLMVLVIDLSFLIGIVLFLYAAGFAYTLDNL